MEKDLIFFENNKIIDYSFLIGFVPIQCKFLDSIFSIATLAPRHLKSRRNLKTIL
jgi:hypothetical protein